MKIHQKTQVEPIRTTPSETVSRKDYSEPKVGAIEIVPTNTLTLPPIVTPIQPETTMSTKNPPEPKIAIPIENITTSILPTLAITQAVSEITQKKLTGNETIPANSTPSAKITVPEINLPTSEITTTPNISLSKPTETSLNIEKPVKSQTESTPTVLIKAISHNDYSEPKLVPIEAIPTNISTLLPVTTSPISVIEQPIQMKSNKIETVPRVDSIPIITFLPPIEKPIINSQPFYIVTMLIQNYCLTINEQGDLCMASKTLNNDFQLWTKIHDLRGGYKFVNVGSQRQLCFSRSKIITEAKNENCDDNSLWVEDVTQKPFVYLTTFLNWDLRLSVVPNSNSQQSQLRIKQKALSDSKQMWEFVY